jgi:hypothetical protein
MKSLHQNKIFRLIIAFILLLLLASCNNIVAVFSPTPAVPISPKEQTSGLPPDTVKSLNSLEKLDNYPFYVMHYYGDYDYPQTGSTWPKRSDFSCSLFTALREDGDKIYGRNFDWSISPALLLFTDLPDGYASVSMVDLEFLGIQPEDSKNLAELPLEERTALLSAPSMPFDGMNEYGLTVGMAALPGDYQDHAPYDPSKPTIGSIGIIRQILDHAQDVDEAVAFFEQYNIDFRGGPLIHYLLAEPGGKAVLVEFYQGEMLLLPNEADWHVATNHFRCAAKGDGGCMRYRTISERLAGLNGQLDAEGAMQLLSDVKQDMTQWSAVYDMSSGKIDIALGGEYGSVYSFQLDLIGR